MTQPATFNDDPQCGHEVSQPYQTHYCTYIRVPRLLSLRDGASPDELLLLTAYQWYELWFKVLLTDLRALPQADPDTYEPEKLLRRGLELFNLFDQHAAMLQAVHVRELGLQRRLSGLGGLRPPQPSPQFAEITRLADNLRPLAAGPQPVAGAAAEYLERLESFSAAFHAFAAATLQPGAPPAPGSTAGADPDYSQWLSLPQLLDLQQAVKSAWAEAGQPPDGFYQPEHISPDENLFVIVHQAFEIYFQVILSQVDLAVPALQSGDIPAATAMLRGALRVQRLLTPQIQMPATMLPLDFLRFREIKIERDGRTLITGLTPASGTESFQFREVEIVCGLRDDPVFQRYLAGSDKLPVRLLTPRQRQRLSQPTLPEAFDYAIRQRGLQSYQELFTPANVRNPNADLATLADILLDFDEFFRFWRLGHVSMVEKMIGSRSGTGFLGPEYLAETAGIKLQQHNRVFEDRQVRPMFFEAIWKARGRD